MHRLAWYRPAFHRADKKTAPNRVCQRNRQAEWLSRRQWLQQTGEQVLRQQELVWP